MGYNMHVLTKKSKKKIRKMCKQAGAREENSRSKFEKHARKLMKFLNDEYHPHAKIIITPTTVEVLEGSVGFGTDEFVRD